MPDPNRYDSMTYAPCGKWGLKLPLLSLGGWQTVGGYEAAGEAQEVFFRAFNLGITHFDFANNYGVPPGNGEIVGGRILAQLPRDELIISSKAGYRMWPGPYGEWGSRKYLIASCDQSLKRLGLDYVDIFYSHRFDPDTPLEETLGALNTIVAQGKALYAGISSYDGEQSREAVRICRENGWAPVIIHQPVYNMFNRRIEDDLLPVAHELGFGVIVFCPLAQGILTDRYLDGVPEGSRLAQLSPEQREKMLPDAKLRKIRRVNEIAKARGQTLAQMALAWCLRLPEVTSVLTAVSRLAQLEEIKQIMNGLHFDEEELQAIKSVLDN